mmetsp:Transcript_11890/g.35236  ORF Transcript_11890/g.35236 Transcript_11890/m.35236 type:complete len:274 (-) Transcript_11890:25-846(-)
MLVKAILKRDPKGKFGLYVCANGLGKPCVDRVVDLGVQDTRGLLEFGDEIVAVNGIDVRAIQAIQGVKELIASSRDTCTIEVRRAPLPNAAAVSRSHGGAVGLPRASAQGHVHREKPAQQQAPGPDLMDLSAHTGPDLMDLSTPSGPNLLDAADVNQPGPALAPQPLHGSSHVATGAFRPPPGPPPPHLVMQQPFNGYSGYGQGPPQVAQSYAGQQPAAPFAAFPGQGQWPQQVPQPASYMQTMPQYSAQSQQYGCSQAMPAPFNGMPRKPGS